MSSSDFDSTQSSRTRLLQAGKRLFALRGYEQTSTAAIARESGSSESQLIRYFGGKAGLLEAIFNEAWAGLNHVVQQQIDDAPNAREALLRTISAMIRALNRDQETAFLFLFEGRRPRAGSRDVVLSEGYAEFARVLDALIRRGIADGSLRSDLDPRITLSAVVGAAEGIVRERALAIRSGSGDVPDEEIALRTFAAMVHGLA